MLVCTVCLYLLQKEGKEKQLSALRSIVKYVESSSNDLAKILGAWQVKDKIVKLEKEIAKDRQKAKSIMSKRRFDEIGSSAQVLHSQEIKRPNISAQASASLISSHLNGLHEQRLAMYADSIRSYENVLQNSKDISVAGHINSYRTASPNPYASSAVGVHPAAAAGGGVAHSAGSLAPNSYSLAHREAVAGQVAQIVASGDNAYGWHDMEARYDMSAYDQSSFAQTASAAIAGYLPSDSYGTHQDYNNAAAGSRSSASDLYRFADTVAEAETHISSSIRPGSLPSIVHAHHSAYIYPK